MSQLSSFHVQPCSPADYGWDEACEHAFAPHRAAGLSPARIVRAERGLCEAVTDAGILRVKIPADQSDPRSAPCTGDRAALRPATTGHASMLHAVLARRTALVRSTASPTSRGQVLAANVDTIVVTASLAAPLTQRIARADPRQPGMPEALTALRAEITMRREHGSDYNYAAYLLHPYDNTPHTSEDGTAMTTWTTRPETAKDITAVRDINLAAFPTAEEADLVDALRADPKAWIDGLSMVTAAPDGALVGHALLTRCRVDGEPALALAPCAVVPSAQRTGAGSAAIRAALDAARAMGENLVLVLGHADYYPRFGFTPASRFGIRAPFEVPDEAMMAMALDDTRPIPAGTIQYPAAFGI